jgi:hypothetical protein
MSAPLHCYNGASGGNFLESWGVTASEGIPHPYHMYTKCFSTLIWGVGEGKWCCSVMVEATNSFRRHPTSIPYVYKVF